MSVEDRSSNIDYEDCNECAIEIGSGICSNCEGDGGYCPECSDTGRCGYCQGTGRRKIELDPAYLEYVQSTPLIDPADVNPNMTGTDVLQSVQQDPNDDTEGR